MPDPISIREAASKLYVDSEIDQPSLVRNNQDNDFNNYNLTDIKSITLNTQAIDDNQVIAKAYVDQFHQENERSSRYLGIDFYNESDDIVKNNQDNDYNDNKLTNSDSVQVNRNPSSDNELVNKKYIDDSIREGILLRFNQALQKYLKVSVGSDIYHLTKNNKIQLTNETVLKYPNAGSYLLPLWRIVCSDRKGMENKIILSNQQGRLLQQMIVELQLFLL